MITLFTIILKSLKKDTDSLFMILDIKPCGILKGLLKFKKQTNLGLHKNVFLRQISKILQHACFNVMRGEYIFKTKL